MTNDDRDRGNTVNLTSGQTHNGGAFAAHTHSAPEASVVLPTPLDATSYPPAVETALAAAGSYYDTDVEVMSDSAYDRLVERILTFETANPESTIVHQLHTAVGAGASAGGDIVHDTPMLSLDKANTFAEVQTFLDRAAKAGSPVVAEPKLDGMAINATYVDGKIVRVGTRGDGHSGEDITDRILALRPANLPTDVPYPGRVNIRGELLMTADDFAVSNANRQSAGKAAFANPRNATAGSVRASNLGYKVDLSFVTYDIVSSDGAELEPADGLFLASDINLAAIEGLSILEQVTAFGDYRRGAGFGFPTDGIVLKMTDLDVRDELGATSRAPRWAIAYKYEAERAMTRLLGIETAVGRTGAISYTAILEPVEVDGSVVGRATLHNAAFIADRDLRIGDMVSVHKANDIIPRVEESFAEYRPADSVPYEPSHYSPTSGELLDMSGVIWRSTDPADSLGSLLAYATSRDVFDVDGFGTELGDALANNPAINDIGDVFAMSEAELAALQLDNGQLYGAVRAAKVYAGIQAAKEMPLNRVITSLGIRKSGRTFGRRLASHFGSMEAILAASESEFLAVEGVADERARLFYEGFQKNRPVIEKMVAAGVKMQHAAPTAAAATGGSAGGSALAGLKVVVTGAMTGPLAALNRNQVQELIEAHGGAASGSVSKSTSLLVCGEPGSSKYNKALELGVKIVTPEEFAGMLGL
jgi:DNA ligase (NAD+)